MFASAYLTLASIIQGVALAALVQRVESTNASFDATSWIMTTTTFLAILVIWQEYLVQAIGFEWAPTLIDSIVPFAFVAGEVFMAHFVAGDLRDWLAASGLTFLVGLAAWLVGWNQARRGADNNRVVLRDLPRGLRYRGLLSGAMGLVGIGAWALYDPLGFSHSQVIVATGFLGLLVVYVTTSVPYWNYVAAHRQKR